MSLMVSPLMRPPRFGVGFDAVAGLALVSLLRNCCVAFVRRPRIQAGDFSRAETEFFENLIVGALPIPGARFADTLVNHAPE